MAKLRRSKQEEEEEEESLEEARPRVAFFDLDSNML